MTTVNITTARSNLYKIIEEVNANSIPITIINTKGKNAVIMSEDDYNAIQETVYLYSAPELVKSITKASKEDRKKMKKYNPNEEF